MLQTEGRRLGEKISELVNLSEIEPASALLTPVLAQRIHFPVLGTIGEVIGRGPLDLVNRLLERIARENTMGGWVVIGLALREQLQRDFSGSFDRCHKFIVQADSWHGTDNLSERVPGPALLMNFEAAFEKLQTWRDWLVRQVQTRRCRAIVLRKALTYLPIENQSQVRQAMA